MKINTLSTFPDIIKNSLKYGVLSKAIKNKLIELNHFSYFNEIEDKDRIDDEQYGHSPGMVISYMKNL